MFGFIRILLSLVFGLFSILSFLTLIELRTPVTVILAVIMGSATGLTAYWLWPRRRKDIEAVLRPTASFGRALTQPLQLQIDYANAAGDESRREIVVNEIEDDGDRLYLHGYCRTAKGPRSFRTDRIRRLIDLETGEVVENDVTRWARIQG